MLLKSENKKPFQDMLRDYKAGEFLKVSPSHFQPDAAWIYIRTATESYEPGDVVPLATLSFAVSPQGIDDDKELAFAFLQQSVQGMYSQINKRNPEVAFERFGVAMDYITPGDNGQLGEFGRVQIHGTILAKIDAVSGTVFDGNDKPFYSVLRYSEEKGVFLQQAPSGLAQIRGIWENLTENQDWALIDLDSADLTPLFHVPENHASCEAGALFIAPARYHQKEIIGQLENATAESAFRRTCRILQNYDAERDNLVQIELLDGAEFMPGVDVSGRDVIGFDSTQSDFKYFSSSSTSGTEPEPLFVLQDSVWRLFTESVDLVSVYGDSVRKDHYFYSFGKKIYISEVGNVPSFADIWTDDIIAVKTFRNDTDTFRQLVSFPTDYPRGTILFLEKITGRGWRDVTEEVFHGDLDTVSGYVISPTLASCTVSRASHTHTFTVGGETITTLPSSDNFLLLGKNTFAFKKYHEFDDI
ncbi:MAG: hypothetical protein Q4C70_11695 [Planctomycetia bacterium]|nr:hypothetical protein [Planctomycetia bacterium]